MDFEILRDGMSNVGGVTIQTHNVVHVGQHKVEKVFLIETPE